MPYRFATDRVDYSDFASGRVFYNAPDHPAFPVRLISEIFQRCMAIREENGQTNPVNLYDPCCGAAYHLAVLGYLHGHQLAAITGSDVDEEILTYAERNLSLLTEEGLIRRKEEIENMIRQFGKASHLSALETVEGFRNTLRGMPFPIETHLFQADATQTQEIASTISPLPLDIVFADIPYNQHSAWKVPDALLSSSKTPVWHLLEAIIPVVAEQTIIAIASDKAQKIIHEAYQRLERFQVGKRQVVFLRL